MRVFNTLLFNLIEKYMKKILTIECDKTYNALSNLDTYEIFNGFDHECKIAWKGFCNLVKNIEKVKQQTIDSLCVMHNCTAEGYDCTDTTVAYAHVRGYKSHQFLQDIEHLNHLCETFKQIASEEVSNKIDYIIFTKENN